MENCDNTHVHENYVPNIHSNIIPKIQNEKKKTINVLKSTIGKWFMQQHILIIQI